MKKLFVAAAAFTVLGSATPADAQETPEPPTITAHVVDQACYLNAGLMGDDHKMCTEVCANAGVQLVFLGEDGNIYLPSGAGMPSTGQNDKLLEFAEQQVRVTGPVIERSGSRSIVVRKIEGV